MPGDNNQQQKPVILIAFANDLEDQNRYLRNLPIEQRGIRNALDKAKRAGLCEVVELTNTTIEDLFDVFQEYRERIAIFHYGGHAESYKLLLETPDGRHSFAKKDGLVPFFSRRKSLRLIFLNACSTQQHAEELLKEGIPAVISTSQNINDEIAASIAIRFYQGLASGISLKSAWRDAEDYIKTKPDLSNLGIMYNSDQQRTIESRFPWDIFFKDSAEKVKEWNLPSAAKDPLYGLPDIPKTHILPDSPFLFLNYYERKHAEIFFGRSYYIRKLYNLVTDKSISPIILLNGQTGVGKSSLLEAGLLPRLEESHTVIYIRRNQKKGLLKTLTEALNNQLVSLVKCSKKLTIWGKWKFIEFKSKKPLIIILDQVEQVYTQENKKFPHEFEYFSASLKTIFKNPPSYPEGKLILVYRKEYHSEINEQLKNHELERTSIFLQPLERQDIIEVINELTFTERLRAKYNLDVEDQLPNIIAGDLLRDHESPVAPTLQIILTKMWENSKLNARFPHTREFTVKQYQSLYKKGLLLEDFFKQQMEKLKKWNKEMEIFDSGLVLDILKFHTTEFGSARSHKINEIRQRYQHRSDIIDDLIKQLKHLYLLTDTHDNKNEITLAHDTLAPIIIKKYNDSDKPGQRAARLIAARIGDFKKKPDEVWLNGIDLDIIESGKKGMRKLSSKEEELLEESKNKIAVTKIKENKFKIIRRSLFILLILFVIFIAVVTWQCNVALYKEKVRKITTSNHLVFLAQSNGKKDPTIAFRLAESAWYLDKNDIIKETLYKIYRENNFYKIIETQKEPITSVSFSQDGKRILTCSLDGTARLWDLDGNKLQDFKGHTDGVNSASFSPDGTQIITGSRDRTAKLWDLAGNKLQDFTGHNDWVNSVVFSPDGNKIVTASSDRTARLWDLEGNQLLIFEEHRDNITSAAFSPDGEYILTGSEDESARLWDLKGNQIWDFGGDGNLIHSVAFSPDGKYILTGSEDGSIQLWDFKHREVLEVFTAHKDQVSSVTFSSDSNYILTGSRDMTALLLDLELNEIHAFIGHAHFINSAVFVDNDKYILTGSEDKTARLWKIRPHNFEGCEQSLEELLRNIFCEPLSEEQKKKYGIQD